MKNIIGPILFILCLLDYTFAIGQTDSLKKVVSPTITWNGYAEVYYLYNFNNPANHEQPAFIYSYNRSNEINLNIGYIKGSYSSSNTRANLSLMTGTYAVANLAAEPSALRILFEGNVGVKLSHTKNLWLDAGVFPSHIGFESAIGKDCWNLTRSILAENSPYYESGIKIGYTSANEKWFLAGMILNGWQRIKRQDGNSTPTFGTQVIWKPANNITLNSSTYIGSDKPDTIRKWRYFHNLFGIVNFPTKWSLMIGLDAGAEQKEKNGHTLSVWYSPVVIVKYILNGKISLSGRAEYYRDKNGVIIYTGTANGFQTTGLSFNFDYAVRDNVLWRLEARSLQSNDNIFQKGRSQYVNSSSWLATSISIVF